MTLLKEREEKESAKEVEINSWQLLGMTPREKGKNCSQSLLTCLTPS